MASSSSSRRLVSKRRAGPQRPVGWNESESESDEDLALVKAEASDLYHGLGRHSESKRGGRAGRRIKVEEEEEGQSVASSSTLVTSSTPTASTPATPSTPTTTTTTTPWPTTFTDLERTFRALNTVYTFCTTRKQLATTFATLRLSVGNLLGLDGLGVRRRLEVRDVSLIKALLPDLVRFAYVEEEGLRMHQGKRAQEIRDTERKWRDQDGEAYHIDPETAEGLQDDDVHVLLFEFVDGREIKSNHGEGKWRHPKSTAKKRINRLERQGHWLPKMDTSTPSFSVETMRKMIDRRNAEFKEKVDELVQACSSLGSDPWALLVKAASEHLPVKPMSIGAATAATATTRTHTNAVLYSTSDTNMTQIIDTLTDQDWYKGQIVKAGTRDIPERQAQYGQLSKELSHALKDALFATKRIDGYYTHQAEAINNLWDRSEGKRHNVIVSTSTSSGKSLIYQIPVLHALEEDQSTTALYIFPTKALAQDQKRALVDLLAAHGQLSTVMVATFDGDTPHDDRQVIRESASVIFTNPDMLHVTILPGEEQWRRFFRSLKYVVVDELHVYNGLFGCHVAYVMRRLSRICHALGNHRIQFISCSATVSDPIGHMKKIFGVQDVLLTDCDGSPAGRKHFICWNPPHIDEHDRTQGRVSSIQEASRLFRYLMDKGIRTIVFCKIRKTCEVLMRVIKQDYVMSGRQDMVDRVMSYRSGYSPQDRRKIEREMFTGALMGIIATTALELGIDIGSLDAVIMLGFPYTIAGLRQQSGRAGRRQKDSLSVLLADPYPTDQHYMRNPKEVFDAPNAELNVDLDNPIVLEGHLQCASYEMPVHPKDDQRYFGDDLEQFCQERLIQDDEGFYHCHPRFQPRPARHVALRSTEDESYSVIDITNGKNMVLEELESSRAIYTAYEGAVYMHMGKTYVVNEMNHDRLLVKVTAASVDWCTRQRDYKDVDAMEVYRIRTLRGNREQHAFYGRVKVTSVVFGYYKLDRRNNILDSVELDMPPFVNNTHGVWFDIPLWVLEILNSKQIHIPAAIHAAEHALLSLTPLYVMSVTGDVKTECKSPEKEYAKKHTRRTRPARLVLYDANGASGGICAKIFDYCSSLMQSALDAVEKCPCDDGCPQCVAGVACTESNIVLSKQGAMVILKAFAGVPIDVASIPMHELPAVTPGETIVLAAAVKVAPNAIRVQDGASKDDASQPSGATDP